MVSRIDTDGKSHWCLFYEPFVRLITYNLMILHLTFVVNIEYRQWFFVGQLIRFMIIKLQSSTTSNFVKGIISTTDP